MAQIDKTFTISGMSCGGCVNSLTRVLKTVPGIEPLKIEVGKAALRIDTDKVTDDTVKSAVERAGFEVAGVTCLPRMGIALVALLLIGFINWYFLGKKRAAVAAPAAPGGAVDVTVRVEARYSPSVIEVPAGSHVRLTLDRQEDNPCSDELRDSRFRHPPRSARLQEDRHRVHRNPGTHEFKAA